jgi:transcriptional regulator with XRE-family HTH domain
VTSDEQIGRNLASARGELSQKDLASKMRERGFKWSQATVWSIEKGERPLRLSEAQEVADILNRDVDVLLVRDGVAATLAWSRQTHESYQAALAALAKYDEDRAQLAISLDQIPEIEKRGRLAIAADWVTTNAATVLQHYKDQQNAEGAASLARMGLTPDEWEELPSQNGPWLDAYNESIARFLSTEADGIDQAAP